MKKLLLALTAVLTTAVTFGQTLPAPSAGHWVIVDTSYTVGTSTVGATEADLYYNNDNTPNNITGLQFRVFYDKVAFSGALPTVSLNYSSTDQYLQYVADSANGNITVTLVYTGTNSSFSYSNGAAVKLNFTHAAPAVWNTLDSIQTLKITGTQVFNNLAATNLGNDTTLSLYSYGGQFIQQTLTFKGTFLTTAGDGAKNLWLGLEKKPKTGSTWTLVNSYQTDTLGKFLFTETLDTTYWDTRIAIQGDTLNIGNVISTADAQKINQSVLGQYTPAGFDFYTMDVNGSNSVTITDAYAVFGRIAGNFASWPNSVQPVLFFTPSEFATIDGSSTNYTSTISGVTNFTHYINGGADSVLYYVAVPGDANSTGFQMARLTPIKVTTPELTPNYIIDQTVKYDNVLEEIEVRFPDLSVDAGNMVNVPVKVFTGNDELSALQLNIKYNEDLLEFKNVINSEKVMNWLSFVNPDNGAIHWGGADFSNEHTLINGETAFTLQFLALEPQLDWGYSPLYVAEKYVGDVNAKDMNILPTNGRMEIKKRGYDPDLLNGIDILTFPNPANNYMNVQFNVAKDGDVKVALFDVTGKKLIQLIDEYMVEGQYLYEIDLSVLANGVYYTSILTRDNVATSKTVIIK